MRKLLLSAALLCAVHAAPASAAVYLFDFLSAPKADKSQDRVTFSIDTAMPKSTSSGIMIFRSVAMIRNGTPTVGTVQFNAGTAGFQVADYAGVGGVELFTGTTRDPVFNLGSFSFWNKSVLTIAAAPAVAAVPEPATWAMMVAGFAAVGQLVRRRRRAPTALA